MSFEIKDSRDILFSTQWLVASFSSFGRLREFSTVTIDWLDAVVDGGTEAYAL